MDVQHEDGRYVDGKLVRLNPSNPPKSILLTRRTVAKCWLAGIVIGLLTAVAYALGPLKFFLLTLLLAGGAFTVWAIAEMFGGYDD